MANELQDKALEEIRREVIEGRNLVIKTDNQLKTLHAELKLVGKRQEDFQRRQWISSAVAYVVFAGLSVAGAMMISNARTASSGAERERLDKQVKELAAQIDQLKAADVSLAANERSASEVYKLMSTGTGDDRLKGIDALAKLDQNKQSAFARQVLQDRAVQLRKEVGAAILERGKNAFRKQDYPGTVTELTRFMSMNPVEEDAIDASYYLGNALIQVRKSEEAVPQLQRYIAGDRRAKNRDYAMLMLVQALDATGQRDKAAELAREALNTYPASEFVNAFRLRLAPRTASPAVAPAAAPAAAPTGDSPRLPLKAGAPAPVVPH
jgi:TolA-binding protein